MADDGSNVLIVRASATDYNQIERLVADLDNPDAVGGLDMKIVTLKPGVNATEMADMIDGSAGGPDAGPGSHLAARWGAANRSG